MDNFSELVAVFPKLPQNACPWEGPGRPRVRAHPVLGAPWPAWKGAVPGSIWIRGFLLPHSSLVLGFCQTSTEQMRMGSMTQL